MREYYTKTRKSLIPTGLLVAYIIDPGLLNHHVFGAALGLITFVGIARLYAHLRDQEGLGLGDAKLLAGAGAWLGWAALPGVVLMAACSALAAALIGQTIERKAAETREIAFGPHLAFAFWVSWLFGPLAFDY